jgi:histidyl-tRNA synthetase
MNVLTTRPRGTSDILPEEVWKWRRVETVLNETAALYGYSEIRLPVFEHTELFQRGIGDATDVVEKEMYTFMDRGGKKSLTLRPEGTAGAARAYLEHKLTSWPKPVKLYYMGSMFRYDRPQAGRYREFHQFGVENLGLTDPAVDAETVALAYDICRRLGLRNLKIRLNSVGCPQCRGAYREKLRAFLRPVLGELCETCRNRFERNPMRILDCKNDACRALTQGAPAVGESLCEDCASHFQEVRNHLDRMGAPYELDPSLVRGLDYYTRTAFEIETADLGAQSSVCGGGRYDHLIKDLGGPETPGMGFALGLERLILIMEAQNLFVQPAGGCDVFVAALGLRAAYEASALIQELRGMGLAAERDYQAKGLKSQMKAADRLGAKVVLILGEDELSRGEIVYRRMDESAQETLSVEAALGRLEEVKGAAEK